MRRRLILACAGVFRNEPGCYSSSVAALQSTDAAAVYANAKYFHYLCNETSNGHRAPRWWRVAVIRVSQAALAGGVRTGEEGGGTADVDECRTSSDGWWFPQSDSFRR